MVSLVGADRGPYEKAIDRSMVRSTFMKFFVNVWDEYVTENCDDVTHASKPSAVMICRTATIPPSLYAAPTTASTVVATIPKLGPPS